jgi:hypothetical protein
VITATSIASNAITSAKIAADAIGASQIAANAIGSAEIADGAITAAKIANGAIDAATFAADVDAEILSYLVDDATRIDASALNTASVTSIPAILDDTGTAGVVVASGSKSGYSLTATTGLGNQTATISAVTTVTNLTNAPTSGDLTATMKASVNTEIDTALADIHLDHLLAADYDPASKPGVSTALLNELIESNAGVSRCTAAALGQAPTGGWAPSVGQIADEVQTRTIAAVTIVNGLAANVLTSAATDSSFVTELETMAQNVVEQELGQQLGNTDIAIAALDDKVDTLLTRITATLFSGITSLGDWIRRITRKDAGTAGMIAAEAEIDTGGTSTFTGTTDSLEAIRDAGGGGGGGGDPWTTDVSTGYTYPEAGAMLKEIREKAALITATNVQFNSMVNTEGYIDGDIIIGDDYLAANGMAFQWTFTPNSGFVAATSSCKFGGSNASGTSTWLVTGTVTDNGNSTWTISFDLPLATTSTLLEGMHEWSAECISATNVEITKKRSGKKVKIVRKWTN